MVRVMVAPPGLVAATLLLSASTWAGRLSAVVALAGLGMLVSHQRARVVCAALGVCAALAVVALAPSGATPAGATVKRVLLDGGAFSRWSPTNLVPEVDQLTLATHFVWMVDPILDRRGAARLRAAIRATYATVERDPGMRALGSAMDDALLDADRGRLFVCTPPHAAGEQLPAVIFLHGSAGSWKGYFALWCDLARRERFVLVQPSFGFGDWHRPGGLEAIEAARVYALAHESVAPSRVFLAGLSNGGRGLTRVMATAAPAYRGLIAISAVLEPAVLASPEVSARWRGVPVLVLHGGRDDRIPTDYLDEGVTALREAGLHLRVEVTPDEDHFLIFTRPRETFDRIGSWIAANAGRRRGD
jgi:predicted esterase